MNHDEFTVTSLKQSMPAALAPRPGLQEAAGLRPGMPGLIILMLILLMLPFLLPDKFYYDIAILACLNAIACIGLNLLFGYTGQISLGHAGFFGMAGYTSAILQAKLGWPPLLALALGVAAVAVLALAIARPVLKLKGHYLAMATLALGIIISVVLNNEQAWTGGSSGMPVPSLSVFGKELSHELAWYGLVAALLVAATWLTLNLIDSPVGRALRAVNGSETAATAMGIDTLGYKVQIFVLSAIYAALAGALASHFTGFITPVQAGFFRSIEFISMIVLGGIASTFGAIVGAVVLTALPQLLVKFEDYEMIIHGCLLMGVLIFMPKGLVPSLMKRLSGRKQ